MSKSKIIAKNTIVLLFSGIFCGVLQFIAIAYIARVLGPDDFGKISFAIAVITYFTIIANFGLPLLGTREVARNRDKPQHIIREILILRLFLSIIGFVLLLPISLVLNEPMVIRDLIILYGLGIIPSALFTDWIFQGLEKMEYVAFGNVLNTLSYIGLLLIFIKGQDQILLIPIFQIIATFFSTVILFLFLYRQIDQPLTSTRPLHFKALLINVLPIGLSLIFMQIFYNIDTVILGFLRSTQEVGYYNAAYKLIMVLITFMGYFHNSIFPVISDYYQTSMESLKNLVFISQKFIVILAFPIVFGGIILAQRIIRFIFGNGYNEATMPFQILLVAVFIIYVNTGLSRIVLGCNRDRWYLLAMFLAAIVNIGLNLLLIPYFGIIAAAVVTVLSEFVAIFVIYWMFIKIVDIPFWALFVKPFISVLGMTGFLFIGIYLLKLNLIPLILLSMIVYFSILRIIKGINDEDISILKRIIKIYP